jgi:hemerythrin-like domain-containing protein
MPNPMFIIKEDHEKVKSLFASYDRLEDEVEDEKKDLADQILKELTIHARMEEKYFYPRLKEKIDADHPIPVDEAVAEHHAAKVLMLELKVMPVNSETYDAKMGVLEDNIMTHIEEEETELLPQAEEVFSTEELEEIGMEMEKYREDAKKDLLDKLMGE